MGQTNMTYDATIIMILTYQISCRKHNRLVHLGEMSGVGGRLPEWVAFRPHSLYVKRCSVPQTIIKTLFEP